MNISVIIPVYNAEKYITRAVESALYHDCVKEIILIEDKSPDNALKICKKLAKENPRVQLFVHPNNENKGAGPSRNLGIQKATQEYIAFLDADDFFLPNRFVKDKNVFEQNPEADGCYNAIDCHFYSDNAKEQFLHHFNSTMTTVNSKVSPTPQNLFDGLVGLIGGYGYFHLDGFTIKRSFLKKNNLCFSDLRVHQDTLFLIQCAYFSTLYPSQIDEPVSMRGVHEENRITANYNQTIKKQYNRFKMWQKLLLWGTEKKIDKKYISSFKFNTQYHYLLSQENPTWSTFLFYLTKNPSLIYNNRYTQIQEYYIKNKKTHWFLLRIRKKFLNLLNTNFK